jgi:hypothetical protein
LFDFLSHLQKVPSAASQLASTFIYETCVFECFLGAYDGQESIKTSNATVSLTARPVLNIRVFQTQLCQLKTINR